MNAWDNVRIAMFAKDDAQRMHSRVFENEIEGIRETGMSDGEKIRLRAARKKYADAMSPYLEACRDAWKEYRASK